MSELINDEEKSSLCEVQTTADSVSTHIWQTNEHGELWRNNMRKGKQNYMKRSPSQ